MTGWSLFPDRPTPVIGSSSPTPFVAALGLGLTQGGKWLYGYWWFVPPGGTTAAGQQFILWCLTSASTGVKIPASLATAGTLAIGWNFIPLATPIQMPIATPVQAQTGFQINGPFTNQTGAFNGTGTWPSGKASGPLFAYSDGTAGGTLGTSNPWGGIGQGTFSVATADPAAALVLGDSGSAWYGLDVQVSDQPPPGFTGPFSFNPHSFAARPPEADDLGLPYGVSVELLCNQACEVRDVGYWSTAGAEGLANWCGVWDVATRTIVQEQLAPAWSGPGAGEWVQAALPRPARLVPGRWYKLHMAVYGNVVATGLDASDPWGTGVLSGGNDIGPVTAVPLSAASSGLNYDGGNPPSFTDGTVITRAQSTFSQTAAGFSGTPPYPELWAPGGSDVGSNTQDYFLDGTFYLTPARGATYDYHHREYRR